MKWLIPTLRIYRPDAARCAAALGLVGLTTASAVIKPWPLAWILDALSGRSGDTDSIPRWTLALLGAYLLHGVLGAAQQSLVITLGLRGLQRIRHQVFERLLRLSPREVQGTAAGDWIYRATWDTYAFQTLFTHGIFTGLTAGAGVIAMTVVMARIHLPLTAVALATVPPLIAVMRFFGPRLQRAATQAQTTDAGIAAAVQQAVANLSLIQAFTRESTLTAAFDRQAAEAFRARRHQHRSEVIYLAAVAAILSAGTAGMVALGSREVSGGHLTLGQLLVFLAYLAQLYEPLNQLSHLGGTISTAQASAQRVLEWLDTPDHATSGTTPAPRPAHGVDLEFSGVGFAYDPDRPVLRGLDLRLKPGEIVAIVGPSGAGKTTLLQLIPRFLEPAAGQIRWCGLDLKSLDRQSLRRQVSWVLQEPLLLSATIAENIGFGREAATRAEIEAAAQEAHAHEFILRLPQGYDTRVGDGAARLSVGEKQRIHLARAFLKDAPVLLLDEPTSALDGESEAAVLAAVQRLTRGRTTLMVAHRPETLHIAHRILRLESGALTEGATILPR
jgi:ATP-binding cassette subfamily B protein/subfamily B ATP-binding cassette protein MsbA